MTNPRVPLLSVQEAAQRADALGLNAQFAERFVTRDHQYRGAQLAFELFVVAAADAAGFVPQQGGIGSPRPLPICAHVLR